MGADEEEKHCKRCKYFGVEVNDPNIPRYWCYRWNHKVHELSSICDQFDEYDDAENWQKYEEDAPHYGFKARQNDTKVTEELVRAREDKKFYELRNWEDKKHQSMLKTQKRIVILMLFSALITLGGAILQYENNKISSTQVDVLKSEQLPILKFDFIVTSDENGNPHEKLMVTNIGKPLSEFKANTAVFFKVDFGANRTSTTTALVPIEDFYLFQEVTNNVTGPITTLFSPRLEEGNIKLANRLIIDFDTYANSKDAFGDIEIQRYVYVEYKDIMGISHGEYYYVNPFEQFRLNDANGEKIFDDYNNRLGKTSVSLEEVDPIRLYIMWSKITGIPTEGIIYM